MALACLAIAHQRLIVYQGKMCLFIRVYKTTTIDQSKVSVVCIIGNSADKTSSSLSSKGLPHLVPGGQFQLSIVLSTHADFVIDWRIASNSRYPTLVTQAQIVILVRRQAKETKGGMIL